VDGLGSDTLFAESLRQVLRVLDGRAEHDGCAILRLLLPVPDDFRVDGPLVHDGLNLPHVELSTGLADALELVVEPDIHPIRFGRNQIPRGDELANADLVGHVVEH